MPDFARSFCQRTRGVAHLPGARHPKRGGGRFSCGRQAGQRVEVGGLGERTLSVQDALGGACWGLRLPRRTLKRTTGGLPCTKKQRVTKGVQDNAAQAFAQRTRRALRHPLGAPGPKVCANFFGGFRPAHRRFLHLRHDGGGAQAWRWLPQGLAVALALALGLACPAKHVTLHRLPGLPRGHDGLVGEALPRALGQAFGASLGGAEGWRLHATALRQGDLRGEAARLG